jgi:orotate phosphoribosyltransferase
MNGSAGAPLALEFSLDDLRRDVRYACLEGPGSPKAHEVLDPYGFISQPPILRRVGLWVAAQLDPEVTRLAAVGASALGIALATGLQINVPVVFVEDRRVHGEFSVGDAVAVVADITRTGRSARDTVEAVMAEGGRPRQIFVVWDRSLGALELLGEVRLPLRVLMEERSSGVFG